MNCIQVRDWIYFVLFEFNLFILGVIMANFGSRIQFYFFIFETRNCKWPNFRFTKGSLLQVNKTRNAWSNLNQPCHVLSFIVTICNSVITPLSSKALFKEATQRNFRSGSLFQVAFTPQKLKIYSVIVEFYISIQTRQQSVFEDHHSVWLWTNQQKLRGKDLTIFYITLMSTMLRSHFMGRVFCRGSSKTAF